MDDPFAFESLDVNAVEGDGAAGELCHPTADEGQSVEGTAGRCHTSARSEAGEGAAGQE
ncbi:hypothetical protein ACFVXC_30390 [Streptomyces sp. NPDC058257]|uniref:hypothetical protein n=1 Tax=Streptomyces sp. NPDC058257 TaxID=3346409 RepID=UPI0036E05185